MVNELIVNLSNHHPLMSVRDGELDKPIVFSTNVAFEEEKTSTELQTSGPSCPATSATLGVFFKMYSLCCLCEI